MENYTEIRYYNSKGELHRTDGPAIEYLDGSEAWYINGEVAKLVYIHNDSNSNWTSGCITSITEPEFKQTLSINEINLQEIKDILLLHKLANKYKLIFDLNCSILNQWKNQITDQLKDALN